MPDPKKTTSKTPTPKPETTAVQAYSEPSQLLQLAIQKDLDVEKLEKLVAMQQQYEANQARKAYCEALVKFQSMVPNLTKTAQVKFKTKDGDTVDYKYIPLGELVEACKPGLLACGLSYQWKSNEIDGNIKTDMIITHVLGHSETNSMTAPIDTSGKKNPVQARGSTMTYTQRYTFIGGFGLATADSDVDGRLPVNGNGQPKQEKQLVFKRTMVLPKHMKKLGGKEICELDDGAIEYLINYIGDDGKQTEWGRMAQLEKDARKDAKKSPEDLARDGLLRSIETAKQHLTEEIYQEQEAQLLTGAELTSIDQASVDHLAIFLDALREAYKNEHPKPAESDA